MQLHGIIPPIVTPMKEDESLDLPRLRRLIEQLLEQRVHGIFVIGTTGEFYALDDAEKQAIMATAVEVVNKRVPVFAGTGAETTREVIRLNKIAEKERIDGVSIITPYYVAPTQAETAAHYRRIAEATNLPILLYSNPALAGGVKLENDTVVRLAELPNIVGIKDSTGDLQSLIELVRVVPKGFAVFQGRDTLILPALQYGAVGAVPASSNIAPQWAVGIYEAFRAGDMSRAQELQLRLSPVRIALGLATAPGGVKAAMNLLGMEVGPSRGPIAPLPPDKADKLRQVLTHAGLTPKT